MDRSQENQSRSENQHQQLKAAAESAKAECEGKRSVADDLGRQFTESRFNFYFQGMALPIIALVAGALILWLGQRQKTPGSAGVPPDGDRVARVLADPRFSRTAIAGAIWCSFGFFIPVLDRKSVV